MSRWLRWYRGTTENPKFRLAARNGGVTLVTVFAVWQVLLEDAANENHRGVCVKKEDFIAAALDLDDDGTVENVIRGLEYVDLISIGMGAITICDWEKWQFKGEPDFRRSSDWSEIRMRIFARDDFTCAYCGVRGERMECDHIVPVSRGGSHDDENLTTACKPCNQSKRDKLLSEWLS